MIGWGTAITGVLLPATLMWLAVRQGSLTSTAGIAAGLLTAVLAFLAGWEWALGIDAYLLSLVAWIPFRSQAKSGPLDRPDAQALLGAADILAHLAWPAATAIANALLGETNVSFVIYAGALASSSADLWATEIGVLSPDPPRDLVHGSSVSPGTVGAISLLGIVAAILGAWSIGFVAIASKTLPPLFTEQPMDTQWGLLPLICAFAGLIGTMADSVLGSIAQAMYYCPRCDRATDRPRHHCGSDTQKVRGWRGLTNPMVDLIASMIGGAVALVLWVWLA
ncbi:MAG: DUF92 domain-containing protein [Anaerolineae bacterium]